jgi:uncharacterized membrane protein YeiH
MSFIRKDFLVHKLSSEKDENRMKKEVYLSMAAVSAVLVASAMPTNQELSKATEVVRELMVRVISDYRAKK